jgi:hypothetical protein
MSTRTLRAGDRNPLQVALAEESGAAVNLAGCSVTFRMIKVATGEVVVNDAAAVVDDAAAGIVSYAFAAPDTAPGREGIHEATFRVTTGAGIPRTFPARGPIKLSILAR